MRYAILIAILYTCISHTFVVFYTQEDGQDFGIDWGGPVSHNTSDNDVNVPETPNPLSRVDMLELEVILSQEESSVQYGIDTYEHVLEFMYRKLGF